MKKLLLAYIFSLIAVLGYSTQYEYNTSTPSIRTYDGSPIKVGQTFLVGSTSTNESFVIDSVSIYISMAINYNVYVEIYTLSGGLPTGSPISTGTIPLSRIPASSNWVNCEVTSAALSASTSYALVFYSTEEYYDPPTYDLFNVGVTLSNNYTGGNMVSYIGGTWGSDAVNHDLVFRIYGKHAPIITSQPTSITRCIGTSATFSVVVDSDSPTYQWRKGGSNISGATSSSYTIASVVSGSAGNYDCVVTESLLGTTTTSSTAVLTVPVTTSITAHPVSITRCPGISATFSVTALGSGLTYQWQKNGVNISGTSSSYTIASPVAGDAGTYRVIVTGTCGQVTSNTATLTMSVAPSISSHPANQSLSEGATANFSVTASGTTLTYQWQKNTVNISGATSSTYSISNVTTANQGNYRVVVTGACGTVTSNTAVLTVTGVTCAPESYWRFENNGTDEMGNHNLNAYNSAGYTTTGAIEGTYAGNLNVTTTNRFLTENTMDWTSGGRSITFTFKTSRTSGQGVIITSQEVQETTLGWALRHDTEYDRLILEMHNGTTSGKAYTINNSIIANTQYFITIVWQNVNDAPVSIYIDNVLKSTADSIAYAGCGHTASWSIGCSKNAIAYSAMATIDNFSVYKRALSVAERTDLYNNRTANYFITCEEPPPPPPVTSGRKKILLAGKLRNILLSSIERDYGAFNSPAPPPPPAFVDSVPIVIFYENFENLSTGAVSSAQKSTWNTSIGGWNDTYVSVINSGTSQGKTLQTTFPTGVTGEPITDTKVLVDSIYHQVYFQYKAYYPNGFQWAQGGKTFGSFIGGKWVDIPYRGDSIGTGFNTLLMWEADADFHWYLYTHNPITQGNTMSASVHMPLSTTPEPPSGIIVGKSYSWEPYSFSLPNTGIWGGWPRPGTWNGTEWAYDALAMGKLITGDFHTYTVGIELMDGGPHDVFELYIDGICVYSENTNRFRTIDNIHWGVEAMYWNAFFGGSVASPVVQSAQFDDIALFTLPSSHPNFHSGKANIGDTIPIISQASATYVQTEAVPRNARFTQASGTVESHNRAFHYVPGYLTVRKNIAVLGATQYSITMQEFGHYPTVWGASPYARIYRYNSGSATLVAEYNNTNYTVPASHNNITADSIVIEYYTASGKSYYDLGPGFRATYTSNGIGSGTNPSFPPPEEMVATKGRIANPPVNAFTINAELGKGVNVVDIVPYGGTCTPQWTKAYYDAIQAGGFDHVRAVFFGFNESGGANYEISSSVLANVKSIVDSFIVRGVKVVLDYHQPAFLLYPSTINNDRFVSHWGQLADYFSEYSIHDLVFELTNEPLEDYTTWNTLAANAVAAIRAHSTSAERIIIMSPALWAQVAGLPYLTLPDDDGLILSVHYYKPTTFTHQGMSGNEGAVGGHWFNVQPMVKEIDEYFAPLVTFSNTHNIPINVGEFGVNKDYGALLADRALYSNYHARYFELKGWSWAIWDFKQDFGIYTSGAYITDMLDAIMTDPLPALSSYDSTVIYQSNFTSTTGWSATGANLSVSGGMLIASVTTPGSVPADVIVQYPISLEKNKIYRVTYTVSSASSRYTIIKTPYLEWDQPTVTTSQYTNERSFTHYFTNYNGYVQFCIGGSNATFYIHNFKIESIDL